VCAAGLLASFTTKTRDEERVDNGVNNRHCSKDIMENPKQLIDDGVFEKTRRETGVLAVLVSVEDVATHGAKHERRRKNQEKVKRVLVGPEHDGQVEAVA